MKQDDYDKKMVTYTERIFQGTSYPKLLWELKEKKDYGEIYWLITHKQEFD